MGLFGSGNGNGLQMHSRKYIEAVSKTIGIARVRQNAFAELIGGLEWSVDFREGILSFGKTGYPLQFIGSESAKTNTWRWGSDNINGFPDAILTEVIAFHHGDFVSELEDIKPIKVPIDEIVNGHVIASMAVQTSRSKYCYYRCPYEGGAAFVLVGKLPKQIFEKKHPAKLIGVATELMANLPIDHRMLMRSLMEEHAKSFTETKGRMNGTFAGGAELRVVFDALGRIQDMRVPE